MNNLIYERNTSSSSSKISHMTPISTLTSLSLRHLLQPPCHRYYGPYILILSHAVKAKRPVLHSWIKVMLLEEILYLDERPTLTRSMIACDTVRYRSRFQVSLTAYRGIEMWVVSWIWRFTLMNGYGSNV